MEKCLFPMVKGPLSPVISGNGVLLHIYSVRGRVPLTLGISGNYAPFIGGQWKQCTIFWGVSVRSHPYMVVSERKNCIYICDQ